MISSSSTSHTHVRNLSMPVWQIIFFFKQAIYFWLSWHFVAVFVVMFAPQFITKRTVLGQEKASIFYIQLYFLNKLGQKIDQENLFWMNILKIFLRTTFSVKILRMVTIKVSSENNKTMRLILYPINPFEEMLKFWINSSRSQVKWMFGSLILITLRL